MGCHKKILVCCPCSQSATFHGAPWTHDELCIIVLFSLHFLILFLDLSWRSSGPFLDLSWPVLDLSWTCSLTTFYALRYCRSVDMLCFFVHFLGSDFSVITVMVWQSYICVENHALSVRSVFTSADPVCPGTTLRSTTSTAVWRPGLPVTWKTVGWPATTGSHCHHTR